MRLYQGVVLDETLPGSGASGDFTREWCLRRLYQVVVLECLMRLYNGVVLEETLPASCA